MFTRWHHVNDFLTLPRCRMCMHSFGCTILWGCEVIFVFYVTSLKGSVAIAGAVVRWLQDNLGIIQSSEELGMCCWCSKTNQMLHLIFILSLKWIINIAWLWNICGDCLSSMLCSLLYSEAFPFIPFLFPSLCREVGCIRRHVLRLLFRSGVFGPLRALLGAQRERVRPRSTP